MLPIQEMEYLQIKKLCLLEGLKNMSRSEAKVIAENKGGKVLGSISKKIGLFNSWRLLNQLLKK